MTAVTFLSANARDSNPRGFFVSKHIASVIGKSNGTILQTIIETLKTHSPTSYAKLLWQKFNLLWHWYEIPNNVNFYYYRLHSRILRFLPITFFILAPLSIVGIAIAICERRRCAPLYFLLSMHVISILMTYVSSRFRAPLIAALLPFAGLSIARIYDSLKQRVTISTLLICVSLMIVSIWTMRSLPKEVSIFRMADFSVPYKFYYQKNLLAAEAEGNLSKIIEVLEELLQSEPNCIQTISKVSPPNNLSERKLTLMFSRFRMIYANALMRAGRNEEAGIIFNRANELENLSRM